MTGFHGTTPKWTNTSVIPGASRFLRRASFATCWKESKIVKQSSAHTEWRIIGSHNIWKRTGIKSISDIKKFDFEKFFRKNDEIFLVYETISKSEQR
jgi:ectoine hydroxylase-related dioxygenase (phytanoyl-CoA dioxygenase family)